ncbi:MAG TPA: hypothetical protein ENG87_01530 [Candidatus Pacearchaeota archaeon]|nr:hypothetical protein [Candidatus Pacearchaeota archaeon]
MKDKQGNKLTFKEFIDRWKDGLTNITPIQKIKTQIGGTRITLIGLFLGLFVSIYGYKHLWWVGIILVGAIINTGIQYLALIQQRKLLDNLENQFKESEVEVSDEGCSPKELDKIVKETKEELKEKEVKD